MSARFNITKEFDWTAFDLLDGPSLFKNATVARFIDKIVAYPYDRPRSVKKKRRVLAPEQLTAKQVRMYRAIVSVPDETFHRVRARIESSAISGRLIDAAVTKLTRAEVVVYYLCDGVCYTKPKEGRRLINLGNSYRKMISKYSKEYFDPFVRGDLVKHTLSNGAAYKLSIGQFLFYLWADEVGLFAFIQNNMSRIQQYRKRKASSSSSSSEKKTPNIKRYIKRQK